MTTMLAADECCERLNTAKRGFMLVSRVDRSGFRLAKAGQTAIRIRGTFAPQPGGGTVVRYRTEFLPAAIVVLAIVTPLSLLVVGGLFWLAHQSVWEIWPLVPIAVLVIAGNLWISNRQAHWLVDFVRHQLGVSQSTPET